MRRTTLFAAAPARYSLPTLFFVSSEPMPRTSLSIELTPRLGIAAAGIALCCVAGGSSRIDVPSLLVLRPVLIALAAAMLMTAGPWRWDRVRTLCVLLGLFAATMAIQLVPLPPSVWLSLPGRAPFAREAAALGVAQPWRPIALAPDLVWNSLFALLPVAFALIVHAGLPRRQWGIGVATILAIAAVSALLGVVQIVAGSASPAYLFAATSRDLPVGLFANRNHQAVFLAASLPLLAAGLSLYGSALARVRLLAIGVCVVMALFFFVMILVTGSRAGTLLAIVGLAGFLLLLPLPRSDGARRMTTIYWGAGVAAVATIATLVVALGRAASVDRALEMADQTDLRFRTWPVMARIAHDVFPIGFGWGAFDPMFRHYEPDALLKPTFFNHAHNDLLEVFLAGGLPAIAVVGAFMIWWGRHALLAWRRGSGSDAPLARAGALVTGILLAASLVDYPLRTPMLAMVLAVASCWMIGEQGPGQSRSRARRLFSGRS